MVPPMALYTISKEALMESNSYDFMVFRFIEWGEVSEDLEEWEGYVSINESAYNILHRNLCKPILSKPVLFLNNQIQ